MGPFSKTLIVLVIILLIVAFATNPSPDDFERFLKTHINEELSVNDDGFLTWLLDIIVGYGAKYVTYHQDYKFFSIFTIELPGEQDYKFLGLFTVFIPLQLVFDKLSGEAGLLTFLYDHRYILISGLFALALFVLLLFRKEVFYEEG